MPDFMERPDFDIGQSMEMRGPFSWFAVLSPVPDNDSAIDNLVADLAAVLDTAVRIVRYSGSIEVLISDLHAPASDPVLIVNLNAAYAEQWSALDINRSGLVREGPIILWLSVESLTRLCACAPNLRSFLGGSIFRLAASGDEMTSTERQERLADLESHFQISGSEVIAQAEAGTLPPEPHFVEWLVLLGRGDLV
jgi:hypothetical protein